jgi:replicative DNA helicase
MGINFDAATPAGGASFRWMETTTTSRITPLRESEPQQLRTPPYNTDAEQGLLGALLISNAAHSRVSEFLEPQHFGNAVHGRIYSAIGKLIERGQIANPVTLKNLFDQDGALVEIGGAQYLFQLAEAAVTIINAEDYGRHIHDLYLRRQLIVVGEDVVNDAFRQDLDDPATQQIERAEQKLFDLATAGRAETGFQPFKDALKKAVHQAEAAYKREGRLVGVGTGFLDLDDKLGGLHPSDLVILAGRPSMGKTALATNIAFNAARAYKPPRAPDRRPEDGAVVGFFSLEMSAEQLAARLLAEESGVSSDRIRRGQVNQANFDRFVQASQHLATARLFIDDTPALSISGLRSRARRLLRQQGLGLVVVDYLQLLRPSVPVRTLENRVQEIADITRGLKTLAKELNVPVLALSQLSRAVEQRDDKRPMLADLRESGSIEQDADVVMFIFREEYYMREPTRRSDQTEEQYDKRYDEFQQQWASAHGLSEIIIAKQRHGPTGTVKLHFDAETTKFDNYVDPDHLPAIA